jgi:ribosomal protein L37AE/L43A
MKHRNRVSFKACPKCKGDMYLDSDAYGVYWKCLQCGWIFELATSRTATAGTGTDKLAFGEGANFLGPPIVAAPCRAASRR